MGAESKTFLESLKETFFKHEQSMFKYHKSFFEDYNKLSKSIYEKRSAKKLISILEGTEYEGADFFTLHCVEPNSEECIIITGNGEVTFPPHSFHRGAVYPINLLKLKKSGNAKFIGYIN